MLNRPHFLEEFKERGFFFQCTDEESLIKSLSESGIKAAYLGFDATANSLHVGSLMQIMILRMLQKYGIKPIVLIGGGTTRIGDPSFNSKERRMLSTQDINNNASGIKKSISKFIKFGDADNDAVMVDNADWLCDLKYLDFLTKYGKLFSVNRMLSFESVKARLEREQNLSFLEFNYMLLQAYDFMHLHDKYNCILQCGGSDQWGNIVNGVELIRRVNGSSDAFGLTTPLMTTASGAKMGKTEQGAVWLNEDLLSPYNYYQFWRNVDDKDVFKFMRMYTDLSLKQIDSYEQENTNINEFKKKLAFEATKLCHGSDNANSAQDAAISAFEGGNMHGIDTYEISASNIPSDGLLVVELFKISGLCSSNGAARRLIKDGGARLNQEKLQDENLRISTNDLQKQNITLSSGKKRHIQVKLV